MQVSAIRLNNPQPTLEQLEAQMGHHKPKPQPTFEGYNFKLKKMFRDGKLPKDLVDIGGNKITQKNLSGDHALAKSKGGKNTDDNMMLATKWFNNMRGNRPLKEVVTMENLIKWVNQYLKLGKTKDFDFVKYVQDILQIIAKGE
jgi:hypothetical protein